MELVYKWCCCGSNNVQLPLAWWQPKQEGFLFLQFLFETDLKAGSATSPLFGIHPVILDQDGNEIDESPL